MRMLYVVVAANASPPYVNIITIYNLPWMGCMRNHHLSLWLWLWLYADRW